MGQERVSVPETPKPETPIPEATTARQFWIRSPGQGEIVEAEIGPGQEAQVLVRTLYSGISRGTESLVFRGEVPESQYEVMRAPHQEGSFPGPVKYGYMSVGEVVSGPSGAAHPLSGRPVFCLYPHQDRYWVPDHAVTALPEGLPPSRAILAANMETAVNALWDAKPGVGDRVVVIGAGVVGTLIAWLCGRIPGTRVSLVDLNPSRASVASALGVEFLGTAPSGGDADLVVHASGQPDGLVSALAAAGREATVLECSWYGTRTTTLPLGEAFHSNRLNIKASQVGRIPPDRVPRWSHARRLSLALDLLRDATLDVLITAESDFENLPQVLAGLAVDPGDTLCHRIRYPAVAGADRAS